MNIQYPALIGFSSKIVAYHVDLAILCKSVNAGLFISQLLYWTKQESCKDGWIYRTQDQLFQETGMTRRNQENARKVLRDLNILEEKQKGVPKKLYYKINQKCLNDIIEGRTLKNVQSEHSSVNETYTQERTDRTDSSVQSVQTINKNTKDYNKINKESVHTRNDLNAIQEKYGNKSVDPSETTLTADVKNKYTSLNAENKKLLWDELRKTIWDYGKSRNWLDDKYPKRWEMLELAIKDFVGHHIDKGNWESEFFNYERKLIQWIDKDILKESALPYSIWNKTKEDLKGKIKVDSNSDLPDYYDEQLYNSLSGEQLTAYKKKLHKAGYRYDRVKQCWKDKNGRVANGRRLKTKVTDNGAIAQGNMSDVAKESIDKLGNLFEEMGNKMNVNKK